jgi:hypothetical protein
MLFWAALMAGAESEDLIQRWKEVALLKVDERVRADLVSVALLFAELAGHAIEWKRSLEGWNVTESQVANEWITQGMLEERRENLIRVLKGRFPGRVPEDLIQFINQQESLPLLDGWFDAAITIGSIPDFLAELRQ